MSIKMHEVPIEIGTDKSISLIVVDETAGISGLLSIDPDGYLMSLWVHPDVRGQGLGTKMIHRACEILKEQGKQTVGLSVHDENEGARRLYTRLGFLPYIPGHDKYTQYIKVL